MEVTALSKARGSLGATVPQVFTCRRGQRPRTAPGQSRCRAPGETLFPAQALDQGSDPSQERGRLQGTAVGTAASFASRGKAFDSSLACGVQLLVRTPDQALACAPGRIGDGGRVSSHLVLRSGSLPGSRFTCSARVMKRNQNAPSFSSPPLLRGDFAATPGLGREDPNS